MWFQIVFVVTNSDERIIFRWRRWRRDTVARFQPCTGGRMPVHEVLDVTRT